MASAVCLGAPKDFFDDFRFSQSKLLGRIRPALQENNVQMAKDVLDNACKSLQTCLEACAQLFEKNVKLTSEFREAQSLLTAKAAGVLNCLQRTIYKNKYMTVEEFQVCKEKAEKAANSPQVQKMIQLLNAKLKALQPQAR